LLNRLPALLEFLKTADAELCEEHSPGSALLPTKHFDADRSNAVRRGHR
jgi:hypothetical protein